MGKGFRRMAQPHDNVPPQGPAAEGVLPHAEQLREPLAARQGHVENGGGPHLNGSSQDGLLRLRPHLHGGDAVREDERHSAGSPCPWGEHPGHQAAQAVGPGEVTRARCGRGPEWPGGDAGHRPSANAPQAGAGEHHQHHQNTPQGHAPKGDAGKGKGRHPGSNRRRPPRRPLS